MVPSPAAGAAWGCWSCGAAGPQLASPCPHCHAEISPVLLASRRTGVTLYNDGLAAALGGFWSEAAESLERALELAGPDPGVLGLLGLVYHKAGRVAEALAAWSQAGEAGLHADWAVEVRTSPETNADLAVLKAYNEALGFAHDNRWGEALNALAAATGPGSRLALAFVVKGIAAWALGMAAEAEEAWQRAMELDPSVPGLQTCLVTLIESKAVEVRQAVAAAAQAPGAAPAAQPKPGLDSRLLVALLSIVTVAAASVAVYQSRSAGGARTAAQQAQEEVTQAKRQLEETRASLVQSESAVAKAKEALAKAEADLKQAAAREAGALKVLQLAGTTGRATDTEALLAALAEARRLGVTLPAWIEQSMDQNRLKAAIDRYFEGYVAFMADDYDRALTAFDASLKLETNVYVADDAAYLAARSADLAGKPAEAVKWYERLVGDFPQSDYRDDALYFGARAAAAAGDRAKAAQLYRDLLSKFPGSGYDFEAEQALKELGA